jgi:SAM-dependent methyltransferase
MNSRQNQQSRLSRQIARSGIEKAVRLLDEHEYQGVHIAKLAVSDGYHLSRYQLERLLFSLTAAAMERYLAGRPHITYDHKRNIPRRILHSFPSYLAWSELITETGSLAFRPLYDPEQKRLAGGKRLDPLTRRMFRHSRNGIGTRVRALTGGWLIHYYALAHSKQTVYWLCLAGSDGAASMLMLEASGLDKRRLNYTNIDRNEQAIAMAAEVTAAVGLNPRHVQLVAGDIFDRELLANLVPENGVDIIDMFGVLEYLEAAKAAELLSKIYCILKPGGIILSCNMRAGHPEMHLHQRGVGWPGVIYRTTEEIIAICRKAGIARENLSIYQPQNGVYNIIQLKKA